jgi:hypothetical protein
LNKQKIEKLKNYMQAGNQATLSTQQPINEEITKDVVTNEDTNAPSVVEG